MPDLVYRDYERVRLYFEQLGFKFGSVKFERYEGVAAGVILRQFPLPGHPLTREDPVSLVVATAGAAPPRGGALMRLAPSILAADLADLAGAARPVRGGRRRPDPLRRDGRPLRAQPQLRHPGAPGPPRPHPPAARRPPHGRATRTGCSTTTWRPARRGWPCTGRRAVHLDRLLERIRKAGAKAGVALNPATPVELLIDALPRLDYVLLMSVNPGFSGQAFLPGALDKARRLRRMIDTRRPRRRDRDGRRHRPR